MKQLRKNAAKRSIVLKSLKLFFEKHKKLRRLLSRISFVILVIIISYIAFLPNYNDLPEFTSLSDVLNHFFAFFVLSIFLDQGFSPKKRHAFLILFAYGFFIEAVQHFLPNRVFDLMDIAVDILGVVVYYFCLALMTSDGKNKQSTSA